MHVLQCYNNVEPPQVPTAIILPKIRMQWRSYRFIALLHWAPWNSKSAVVFFDGLCSP